MTCSTLCFLSASTDIHANTAHNPSFSLKYAVNGYTVIVLYFQTPTMFAVITLKFKQI